MTDALRKRRNKKHRQDVLPFVKPDDTQYAQGFEEGMSEGMFRSTDYALTLLEKVKHNDWWWVKDACNDTDLNDN
ncbi:MAG: hypothetical protein ACTSXQ_03295 [Alphaproteobacteria bacterium]